MDYAKYRSGSARLATSADLRSVGILGSHGIWIGQDDHGNDLRVPGDGSVLVAGGTGSGKSASLYANNLLTNAVGNSVTFDPRGELSAISTLAATLGGYEVFTFNPTGLCNLAQDKTNPLDHISLEGPSIVADAQKAAMDICPAAPGRNGRFNWWEVTAQDWLSNLILDDAEQHGYASVPGLYRTLTSIQGNIDYWCERLGRMSVSRFPNVQRFAGEIVGLQEEGRDSFTAPLGTLLNAFRFMQDPRIASALDGNDFSMADPCDPARKIRIQIIVPIEYLELWGPAVRLLIGAAIQNKLRNIDAPRVTLLIDECGQLKHFPSVRELYTFGRGAGLVGVCAWQETSQLFEAFGENGGAEIFGSAQFRILKGIRTLESAQLASEMCGKMTLEYDSAVEQSNARRLKQQAVQKLLSGSDPAGVAADLRHYHLAERHRATQPRLLFTPDEVLNLPSSQMIAFASGLVEGPILGHWPKYFERRDLAGRYLPNPYHDAERVRIRTHWGTKYARVIREPVPYRFAALPQYQSGYWSYIEGYRPANSR